MPQTKQQWEITIFSSSQSHSQRTLRYRSRLLEKNQNNFHKMPTHVLHPEKGVFYFVTFTCYRWLPLLEETKIYNYLHFWFDKLREKGYILNGFVIMPNHIHLLVFATLNSKDLSKTMGASKRFLAYEIVKRLKGNQDIKTLKMLASAVQSKERAKGKSIRYSDYPLMPKLLTQVVLNVC